MSDEADFAGDRIDQERERAISAARQQKPAIATGLCFYCDEPVGPSVRFCDKNCADDFEYERRIRARQGAR